MSAPKHTPGPWQVHATDDSLVRSGRGNIASTYEAPGDAWGAANARLIAAAPDMLAALQLINAFMCFEDMDADDPIFAAWGIEDPRGLLGAGKDVLAAIAKAEGRA